MGVVYYKFSIVEKNSVNGLFSIEARFQLLKIILSIKTMKFISEFFL